MNDLKQISCKCLVCDSDTEYFFTKDYSASKFARLMDDIGPVAYNRCLGCGFVFSITHQSLSVERWQLLNDEYHHLAQNNIDILPRSGKPPYLEQAMMLHILHKHNLIDLDSAIDYAGGYGVLSSLLSIYFSTFLPVYERYVISEAPEIQYVDCKDKTFKTVVNSAMFEHVVSRQGINDVNDLVEDDGCLILHSVICETIPQDSNWFYLDPPVHTAFFTNKSLKSLMRQWGYKSSVYCPNAKSWVLFKSPSSNYIKIFDEINRQLKSTWFLYNENGFVDYWKGF